MEASRPCRVPGVDGRCPYAARRRVEAGEVKVREEHDHDQGAERQPDHAQRAESESVQGRQEGRPDRGDLHPGAGAEPRGRRRRQRPKSEWWQSVPARCGARIVRTIAAASAEQRLHARLRLSRGSGRQRTATKAARDGPESIQRMSSGRAVAEHRNPWEAECGRTRSGAPETRADAIDPRDRAHDDAERARAIGPGRRFHAALRPGRRPHRRRGGAAQGHGLRHRGRPAGGGGAVHRAGADADLCAAWQFARAQRQLDHDARDPGRHAARAGRARRRPGETDHAPRPRWRCWSV